MCYGHVLSRNMQSTYIDRRQHNIFNGHSTAATYRRLGENLSEQLLVALDGAARARAQRRAADAHALARREQLRPHEPHPLLLPAEAGAAASGADLHGALGAHCEGECGI
jgi:hypothetical protein